MNDGLWFLEQTMKFAQFQREIENTELLRKSKEIAKNQLRETELQTRLLRKRKNAEREQAAQIEAQAQKIAALEQQIAAQKQQQVKEACQASEAEQRRLSHLPKCPVCNCPLQGAAPSHCSGCDAQVFWINASPCTRAFAVKYMWNDIRPELRKQNDSIREVVEAAVARLKGIENTTRVEPLAHYESAIREYANLVLAVSADYEREITHLRARLEGIDRELQDVDRELLANKWRGQTTDPLPSASQRIAELTSERDAIRRRLSEHTRQPVTTDTAEELKRRTGCPVSGPPGGAMITGADSLLSLFDSCGHLRLFAPTAHERQVFATMAIVALQLVCAKAFCVDRSDLAVRLGFGGDDLPGDVAEGLSSMQQATQSKTFAELLSVVSRTKAAEPSAAAAASPSRGNQEAVRDLLGVGIDQQRLEVLASLFIDSLCCVAVGDRKLSQAEVGHIIQVLRRLENQQDQKVLQAKIVESSKRIFAAGAALQSRLVCERLIENKAEAAFGFILETLRQLAAVDGRSTAEELEILKIFEEQLKAHSGSASGPRYSDLDVAQNPSRL